MSTILSPTVDVYVDTYGVAVVSNNDDLLMSTDPMHELTSPGVTQKIQLKFDLAGITGGAFTAKLYMKMYSVPSPAGPLGTGYRYVHAFKHLTPANISATMSTAQANDFTYANILDTQQWYYNVGSGTGDALPVWHCFDVSAGTTLNALNGYVVWCDRSIDTGGGDGAGFGNKYQFVYRSQNFATAADRPYLEVTLSAAGPAGWPLGWVPRSRVF